MLRAGKLASADIENIAEEIESIGRCEKRELVNRLVVLLLHLLKWRYRPGLRGNSWRGSIEAQRLRLDERLKDNPNLKAQIGGSMVTAYRLARFQADRETGLARTTFPQDCPFTFYQTMAEDLWPE